MANTRMEYLYTDASNYKQWTVAILPGVLTEKEIQTILENRSESTFFIPEQVGLPAKRFEKITEDDHCWFELDEGSFSMTTEDPDVSISAKDLVKKFKEIGPYGWEDVKYAPVTTE